MYNYERQAKDALDIEVSAKLTGRRVQWTFKGKLEITERTTVSAIVRASDSFNAKVDALLQDFWHDLTHNVIEYEDMLQEKVHREYDHMKGVSGGLEFYSYPEVLLSETIGEADFKRALPPNTQVL